MSEEHTPWEAVTWDGFPTSIKLEDYDIKTIISTEDFVEAKEKISALKNLLPEDEKMYRTGSSVVVLKKKNV